MFPVCHRKAVGTTKRQGKMRKAVLWMIVGLLVAACGSDGDDDQAGGTKHENVITVDGVKKPIVDMTEVLVITEGPSTAKYFSVSLNLDHEDYARNYFDITIEEGYIGKRIDISDEGRTDRFSLGYTDRNADISLFWTNNMTNSITSGSYLQVSRQGADYEVDFSLSYVRGRNTHTIAGYYKGGVK